MKKIKLMMVATAIVMAIAIAFLKRSELFSMPQKGSVSNLPASWSWQEMGLLPGLIYWAFHIQP
jgi:hypothetical protein